MGQLTPNRWRPFTEQAAQNAVSTRRRREIDEFGKVSHKKAISIQIIKTIRLRGMVSITIAEIL